MFASAAKIRPTARAAKTPSVLPMSLLDALPIGRKIGSLTYTGETCSAQNGNRLGVFRCDCGNTRAFPVDNLLRDEKQRGKRFCGRGCPLYKADHSKIAWKHGGKSKFSDPLLRLAYASWQGCKDRCLNENDGDWNYYGGRGIYICPRWTFHFETFLKDMGLPPSKKHTLERRNYDGPYTPENCYWATRRIQSGNKRNNIFIEINGKKMCSSDACKVMGIAPNVAAQRRYRGWSIEKSILTPLTY